MVPVSEDDERRNHSYTRQGKAGTPSEGSVLDTPRVACNVAITACERGNQWTEATLVFKAKPNKKPRTERSDATNGALLALLVVTRSY